MVGKGLGHSVAHRLIGRFTSGNAIAALARHNVQAKFTNLMLKGRFS
jgi:hypothetical protein